jgi:prealbumin domain-containing protein
MTIRASRGARLLCAAALAWVGLALCAQAAQATYSKITIVKVNQGGDQNDTFTFDTHLTPSPSPASFSIKAGESSRKTFQVECNAQSACTQRWGSLTQTIGERAASGYTLTGVVCRHTGSSSGWGVEPTQSSNLDPDTTFDGATRKIDFRLDWYEWTKCWVTNTRDTGTIKVVKKVVAPAGDTGKFNLLVDGAAKATNVGDGGNTGDVSVTTGQHTIDETAGTATSLGDYSQSTSCVDTAHPNDPAVTVKTVQVDKGDHWVCTITNTRKTATVKVTKALSPASDAGKFNLLVDGAAKATNVGDGGTTGTVVVLPGAHTVAEAAGTGTDLANYSSTLACKDTAHGNAADNDGTLSVAAGDAWECLFTNTRKTQPPPPGDEPPTTTPPPTTTTTQPKIKVSPARVRPGSAKLRGPSGCPTTNAVVATVTGRRIVKVTFYVDGKKVKTLTKANGKGGRWVLPLNVRRLAFGAHRVQAKVQFAKSSQTQVKTLRLSFDRCHTAAAKPKFTG